MKKILYLKVDSKDLFLKYIPESPIQDYYIFNDKHIIFRVLKRLHLETYLPLGNWKKHVQEYDYIILGDNYYAPRIGRLIKKKNPNCKLMMYFWNIMSHFYTKHLKDPHIDAFWTFDKFEAEKYQFQYNTQFYTKDIHLKEQPIQQDIIFVGRDKGRKAELEALKKTFTDLKITNKIEIFGPRDPLISYDAYLDEIAKSRCILDYNQKGQRGLSLRPLEAMYFKKKLITNNQDILHYDFYHPDNIFILGKDHLEHIKEFLEKDFKPVKEDILTDYDFHTWIQRFIEK